MACRWLPAPRPGHTCLSFLHVCVLTSYSHQDPCYIALGSCHQTQSHAHSVRVRAETLGLWGHCSGVDFLQDLCRP